MTRKFLYCPIFYFILLSIMETQHKCSQLRFCSKIFVIQQNDENLTEFTYVDRLNIVLNFFQPKGYAVGS